ncbi:hypothetical protein BDY17DRAFT_323160 [Neohortaea acidophila]|uniref:proline--tRNA ligase n=1 Tax=Neohortaea acidophila TaxID=245834 RepID=A0A6A6PW74_9PEZI|nr:uncharacterized protein BDY17DRAFT_323160 [Neohortaea acidophila]KAF2484292.1 hypothetical protein BDY17DRAFT_323160 [Neohortaea acidophila]
MSHYHVLKRSTRRADVAARHLLFQRRSLHNDGRNRLSNFWAPTQRQAADSKDPENGHDLLLRAGFLRQVHAGIFHILPLGLRVQNKLERLIDKHMQALGASKVSLSSLSSEELWQRSGRLDKSRSSEFLRLQDRKGAKYLLSPTHEEEITSIVANAVHSYKELPLRLYQVSRKYRDEPRPRQGLLRGREFLMKDLYTFDSNESAAHRTYGEVRKAYVAFLEELKLPYLVARADSGNMGGTLSHEYHFASPQGEDTVITCDKCDYSINEELYVGSYDAEETSHPSLSVASELYISKDRTRLCSIYYPSDDGEPNIYAVKAIFPDVDTGVQGEQALRDRDEHSTNPQKHIHFRDPRLSPEQFAEAARLPLTEAQRLPTVAQQPITFTKARAGDTCPSCKQGALHLHRAVEIGHTFHLGQRYSEPLEALVLDSANRKVPMEMGCHGMGVSRLIGAIANLLADERGLNWPLAIAPFETVIVPVNESVVLDAQALYDQVCGGGVSSESEVLLDDRERPLGWKLHDADLIGYPFIVVLGKAWTKKGVVELQCRRLRVKEEVRPDELVARIREIGARL